MEAHWAGQKAASTDAMWAALMGSLTVAHSAAHWAGLTAASRGATTAVKMDVCWVE